MRRDVLTEITIELIEDKLRNNIGGCEFPYKLMERVREFIEQKPIWVKGMDEKTISSHLDGEDFVKTVNLISDVLNKSKPRKWGFIEFKATDYMLIKKVIKLPEFDDSEEEHCFETAYIVAEGTNTLEANFRYITASVVPENYEYILLTYSPVRQAIVLEVFKFNPLSTETKETNK